MRATLFKTFGVSIAALALGLWLATNPVIAAGTWHGGGGSWHGGGGGWHGGGGGWHGGGGRWGGGGGGWHGAYGGWHGGGGGWNGGYGGNGYWGPALGLGLLGGGIIASQYPYSDSGYGYGAAYDSYPQGGGGDYSAYCANRFRSYDPASGTYLGYDGLRHPCP